MILLLFAGCLSDDKNCDSECHFSGPEHDLCKCTQSTSISSKFERKFFSLYFVSFCVFILNVECNVFAMDDPPFSENGKTNLNYPLKLKMYEEQKGYMYLKPQYNKSDIFIKRGKNQQMSRTNVDC